MKKKVVVTGATGLLGSHLIDFLLRKTDCIVYGAARHDQGFINDDRLYLAQTYPNFHIWDFDIEDDCSIEYLFQEINPDYFINFAGQSTVHPSWDITERTFNLNTKGVLKCLELIRTKYQNCRFFNAGSSEQFGDVIESPQKEWHTFNPTNPYGISKVAAHQLIKTYRKKYGIYAVQGIFYNQTSERQHVSFITKKITNAVARISRQLSSNQLPEALELGNVDVFRDWSYAPESVEAVWRMLNQDIYNDSLKLEKKYGGPNFVLGHKVEDYIISSGVSHTVKEFVELAFDAVGINGSWMKTSRRDEHPTFVTSFVRKCPEFNAAYNMSAYPLVLINNKYYRDAERVRLEGDNSAIIRDLKWKPQSSPKQWIKKMINVDLKQWMQ